MSAVPAPGLFPAPPEGFPDVLVVGNTLTLQLFIPADSEDGQRVEPLHRHRVRVLTPKGGRPRPQVYADPRSAAWEAYVAEVVREQLVQTPTRGEGQDFVLPLEEYRVLLSLRFNLPKPKSYPVRVVHHTKKPDSDNYAKAVIDGLVKGRVLKDDGMVTDLTIQKRYVTQGHPEGVEIDLTAIPCEVP